MPHWFLSTRVQSIGGSVCPVKVLDADRPGWPYDLTPELVAAIQGRDIFFATHGFEVNQDVGTTHLGWWLDNLQIGNALPIGILWPGDATIPLFVDYIIEGHEALASGDQLALFLNKYFTGAVSFSLASHSLGARVVLQTIRGLASQFTIRRVLMMAGAIDNTCLTDEYQDVFKTISPTAQVSILASVEDDVLALAFPLANPLQRLIDHSHPYFRAALGHSGPATPLPSFPPLEAGWQIPETFGYGHHDYLPGQTIPAAYSGDVEIPPDTPVPPDNTPPPLKQNPKLWKPAWSAGFASARYRRP